MLSHVVRFALFAALAGVAVTPMGDDDPDDGGATFEIAAAQQGLDRLVRALSDVAPTEVVACPLVDSARVDASLEAAGVDAPLDEWLLEVRDDSGITCAGSHIGFEDDPSFPQLDVELVVIDGPPNGVDEPASEAVTVTDLQGGTIGTCESDRFVTICEESWQQDGFQVRLLVADRVYFDRVTASTVLGDLVPVIVSNLARGATDIADPLAEVSGADVGAATAGFDRFVSANADAVETDDERLDCPTIADGDFEAVVDGVGIDIDVSDWTASLTPVTFPDDLDPLPIRLTCASGFDPQARIDVIDFGDPTAADDFVASVGNAEGGSASDLQPGDLTVGTCITESGFRFCTEWWTDDGLVVGVWLVGDSQPIGNDDAAAVLVEVLPSVLANLDALDD